MNVIGISAHYHDSACALLRDGILVCAVEEERFSRRKHDPRLPWRAFQHCLSAGGLTISDVDCVSYYESPQKKLSRQLWVLLERPWAGVSPSAVLGKLDPGRAEREIREGLGYDGRIFTADHHRSHAASSFFYSGFEEAASLTVDAVGEWTSTSYGRGDASGIELLEEMEFPHSLGLMYSALTSYLGFEVNEGEYKVMGLAPYGKPRFVEQLRELIRDHRDGRFELDLDFFDFSGTGEMFTARLPALLESPRRQPESKIQPFHEDVARSLQVVLEEVLLSHVSHLHDLVPSENLCMAGGVALNCVANSRILAEGPFERLFVQPAAGDSGAALGAAALAHTALAGRPPAPKRLEHVYLGPEYTNGEIEALLGASSIEPHDYRDDLTSLLDFVVDRMLEGDVIGWFHGRMEFGPRALGSRSIIADPRDPQMRDRINALVKKRESFRPFAPAVLAEKARRHFRLNHPSPFMLETHRVVSHLKLPAITHVDRSARVQTVDASASPRFAALLRHFDARSGCPIVLNTSFNIRGEPIVATPLDAISCFVRSGLDLLVLQDFVIEKTAVPALWGLHEATSGGQAGVHVPHDVYTLL